MTCADQEPHGSHLGVSSESELAEAGGMLDLAYDGFHNRFSSCVQPPAFQGSHFPSHQLQCGETVGDPTPWERIVVETVLFSAAGDVGVDLPLLQVSDVLFACIPGIESDDFRLPGKPGDHILEFSVVLGAVRNICCHNDLMSAVHDDLSIIALDERFLVRHDP